MTQFVSARMAAKMSIVSGAEQQAALSKLLSPAQLTMITKDVAELIACPGNQAMAALLEKGGVAYWIACWSWL